MSDLEEESDETSFSLFSDGSECPSFSPEPGPSHKKEKQSLVSAMGKLPCCALCETDLKAPVSKRCGHQFCMKCIASYSSQSASLGETPCPLCGKRSRTASVEHSLQDVVSKLKASLGARYRFGTEGTVERVLLNDISSQLYITEGQNEEVHTQHEISQLETLSKTRTLYDIPIMYNKSFKAILNQPRPRVVLMNGVAGIGKTFLVQKFTLAWAGGLENQDTSLVIMVPFRELNLLRDEQYSLLTLLHVLHPTLLELTAEMLSHCTLLFILDGLDESRVSLDFNSAEVVCDVTHKASVNVLLINLIRGNLLPFAQVWITSRPAAANQIPAGFVNRVTELRGFTDDQIDEYFKIRFSKETKSSRIISHFRRFKNLQVMCRIPVFCWITATVLEYLLTVRKKGELPNTVTDLYSHFVVVQTQRQEQKSDKYHGKRHQRITMDDRYVLLKLGKLAFEHLEEGNIVFYQEDLEQCGLEMPEDSFNSGVCNRIFKRESVLFRKPVYSFVHRSLQEFLAAVYARQCYNNKCTPVLHGFLKDVDEDSHYHLSLDVYLNKVVEKALHSKNGHLDLFVRFLHGLSLESNQRLLKGLLDRTENSPAIVWKIMKNLKKMNIGDTSPDRSINIFHCLVEMNDVTVDKEIQEFLKSRSRSKKKLSEIHCSALAYKLLTSEQVLDELDLSKYTMSIKGRQRLIPAVKNCRKARLTGCELSIIHCNIVALALSSAPSNLRELDLSRNLVENAGLKQLFDALGSSNCKLESLRLEECNIGPVGCKYLVSALESNPSHLTELDLSENKLRDTGVKRLCGFLASPHCRLRTLSLRKCCLSEISCNALAPVLKSNLIRLRHLDLSENKLEDVGVRKLYGCLEGASGLETLKLSRCGATHESCYTLAAALKSHNSHLLHLDLSHNKLKDLGLKHMCTGLKSPRCRLETLRLRSCGFSDGSSLVPVLNSKLSRLRTLDLTDNKIEEEEVIQLRGFETDSHYALRSLRISKADGSLTELPEETAVGKDLGDFSDEPGPSGSRFNDGVKQPTSFTNLEYLGLPSGFLNIWDSDLDGGWPTDRDQQDTTCADEPAKLKHLELESPKVLTDASKLKIVGGKASYRLWCPGRGSFSCTRTGLVFVVSREAEVVYSTVQWDEGLLDSTGKMAAGPLFDINCSEDAVCELHLPHCDTREDVLSGNWLSVAHISEAGTSFIKPLEVTDTHVVVKTPHLSRFGNVWNDISTFWTRKIPSQVLLFLRPPNLEQKKQKLNVFLLPCNIPLDEVRAQQQGFNYIQAPSNSKLIKDQSYTLQCPQAFKIQPKKADFVIEFGPNYHPTFEIRLPSDSEEATLSVKHHMQEVWEYEACLTDFLPSTEEGSEESLERKLKDVLPEFVQSVTEPIANQLLDRLFKEGVIGNEERESAGKETSAQRARSLIEMVLKKGKEAILILLNALKEKDRVLYKKLKL